MNKIDKRHTDYEWVVECVDKHQDVIDVYHFNTLAQALAAATNPLKNEVRADIALKKDVWFDSYGLTTREYNYLHLSYPDEIVSFDTVFVDGTQVPKKYLGELRKYISKNSFGIFQPLTQLPKYVRASLQHAYEFEEEL